jgi:acetyl-CoA carboxylase carboxyl transferase subunit alpha
MLNFGLIDGIIPEPAGGAHWDYDEAATILKKHLVPLLQELKAIRPGNDATTGCKVRQNGLLGRTAGN